MIEQRGTEGAGSSTKGREVLWVVTACYDEEEVVDAFHAQLSAVLRELPGLDYRILFVDDGSRDGTLDRLNALRRADERVLVTSLSRNFGHQAALTAGLEAASGDAIVLMDCDLQHPPAVVARMVEQWRAGSDVVAAVRRATADAPWLKRLGSRLFYWLIRRLSDTPIAVGVADFCLLSRRAHRALLAMPEHHRFLRGMVAWLGFPRTFVPYDAPERAGGRSKYGFGRMVGLAIDAVFSFSTTPIRVMTRVGAVITTLGFVYLCYVLGRALLRGDLVAGWGSLISTVLIIGGLQLVFMGVIGAYVARVFEEVKRRPLYLVKQDVGDEGGVEENR